MPPTPPLLSPIAAPVRNEERVEEEGGQRTQCFQRSHQRYATSPPHPKTKRKREENCACRPGRENHARTQTFQGTRTNGRPDKEKVNGRSPASHFRSRSPLETNALVARALHTTMAEDLHAYFEKTFEQKLLGAAASDGAVVSTAASTQLLQKRKEMQQVQNSFSGKKQDHDLRMEALQQKREELEQRERELAESLSKFDRFIKENDKRKLRAQRKTQEEKARINRKETRIDTLKQELEGLRQLHDSQVQAAQKLELYNTYLTAVVSRSVGYAHPKELIARYDTLASTNADLQKMDLERQTQIDTLRHDMATRREEHRVEMLSFNNQLANLQAQASKAHTDLLYWENQLHMVQSTASKRTLLLGRIKMATANLYRLVELRTNVSRPDVHSSTQLQLDKIQTFIQDLKDITAEPV
eukprot:m.173248 g.173248  ORF g.173248 m.173248 type:complete len:414 (-) comp21297_c0_seq3:29-1270(-)